MPKHHGDLTGRRFGKLVVLSCTVPTGRRRWLCQCDCGEVREIGQAQFVQGRSKSCGCGVGESARARFTTHGASAGLKLTPTYQSWRGMKMRCDMPNNVAYHRYGGRGIKICERWYDYGNFLADMGERPEGLTLDRIDTDGDYCAENCRWADKGDQSRNRSTTNIFETPLGPMTTNDLAARFGVSPKNVARWARWGWTDAEVFARASVGPLPRGSRVSTRERRSPA